MMHFSKKFGLINDKQNARMLDGDSSYFLLCSLENLDENGELLSKSGYFFQSGQYVRKKAITSADTPADALAISIGEKRTCRFNLYGGASRKIRTGR